MLRLLHHGPIMLRKLYLKNSGASSGSREAVSSVDIAGKNVFKVHFYKHRKQWAKRA